MYAVSLKCLFCGEEYHVSTKTECSNCGSHLEVKYNYSRLLDSLKFRSAIPEPGQNIWRYRALLPVEQRDHMISLFEGGTPLFEAKNLSNKMGLKNLFIKDETRNPTGSFKDRPMAVGVSKSIEFGFRAVCTASSGNGAASLAAYAAKANLNCFVFIPESTPIGKVTQAAVCGAQIIKVPGDYSNAFRLANSASKEFSWMNLTSTFLNPYTLEGDKTVAYELYYQLNFKVPEWIIVPTGAGPLVYGIYKGFTELSYFRNFERLPKMVSVQAEGCDPIVKAFNQNKSEVISIKNPPQTIASAIADPLRGYEKDGEFVLRIIRKSNGLAVSVSDDEIKDAQSQLAKEEGVFAEPSGAASIAGLKKLVNVGIIRHKDRVVCIITGHGLKDSFNTTIESKKISICSSIADINNLGILR